MRYFGISQREITMTTTPQSFTERVDTPRSINGLIESALRASINDLIHRCILLAGTINLDNYIPVDSLTRVAIRVHFYLLEDPTQVATWNLSLSNGFLNLYSERALVDYLQAEFESAVLNKHSEVLGRNNMSRQPSSASWNRNPQQELQAREHQRRVARGDQEAIQSDVAIDNYREARAASRRVGAETAEWNIRPVRSVDFVSIGASTSTVPAQNNTFPARTETAVYTSPVENIQFQSTIVNRNIWSDRAPDRYYDTTTHAEHVYDDVANIWRSVSAPRDAQGTQTIPPVTIEAVKALLKENLKIKISIDKHDSEIEVEAKLYLIDGDKQIEIDTDSDSISLDD